ncbi:MAG: Nif11-like leader peptide family natural product precursor [Microcystis novacekii Mn_MB_F_20050700_S1]|jgi:predicted ribosomally synthesized peptide with nif11-like leader|uniref:Nif11-like leader peptide family natural product n=1 Tax=Microcystis novacekii Mn_MB_F_20050700_S1D TaxID=2486266 RepID=A0A552INT8_9CHRO|nr:MAG: Nif11-like leader peptide family natural product precursor [Microcystis novacekii Mn_MB_F_20050700_S1D]TRU87801.1 MAG: Nif11-like leader peptide family natural product precursor [Microcystis novacekii Mn_MB_F_20050700_S1]
MALEQVHAFYQKVASDESFRSRIQSVNSKEECSEIVKAAGFDFTPQEFEEYTARLLESDRPDEEIKDLSEEDLAAVAGGFIGGFPKLYLMYGLPPNRDLLLPEDRQVRPMYGLPPDRFVGGRTYYA